MAQLKGGTTIAGNEAWHAGNDGAGSGLDADLLDGYGSTSLPVSTAQQAALNLKANQSTTYTKTEVDTSIATLTDWTALSTSTTLTANTKYSVDFGVSPLTLTLPLTPAVNGFVEFYKSAGASLDSIIARNGETIMGLAEDLTIDTEINSLKLIYNGTDWRIS